MADMTLKELRDSIRGWEAQSHADRHKYAECRDSPSEGTFSDWAAAIDAHLAQPASPAGVPDGQVDLPSHIMRAAVAHGGLRQLSRNLGIDVGYLSRLASGEKTEPGDEILAKVGLEKRVTYLSKQAAFMRACEQAAAPPAPSEEVE